jgi:hypothetical protein
MELVKTATVQRNGEKEGWTKSAGICSHPWHMSDSTPKSYFEFLMFTLREKPRLDTWLNRLKN